MPSVWSSKCSSCIENCFAKCLETMFLNSVASTQSDLDLSIYSMCGADTECSKLFVLDSFTGFKCIIILNRETHTTITLKT